MRKILLLVLLSFSLVACQTTGTPPPPQTEASAEQRACSVHCQQLLVSCSNHRNRINEQCMMNANLQAKHAYNEYATERLVHHKKVKKSYGDFLNIALLQCGHSQSCSTSYQACARNCWR